MAFCHEIFAKVVSIPSLALFSSTKTAIEVKRSVCYKKKAFCAIIGSVYNGLQWREGSHHKYFSSVAFPLPRTQLLDSMDI